MNLTISFTCVIVLVCLLFWRKLMDELKSLVSSIKDKLNFYVVKKDAEVEALKSEVEDLKAKLAEAVDVTEEVALLKEVSSRLDELNA